MRGDPPRRPNNGCRTYTTAPITPAVLYTARETTWAGYGQLNLGNLDTISGVIGLRVNRIRTRVSGPVPTGIPIIDDGSEHTEWLPSASLRWRIDPQFQLRLAMSRTETRPDFGQLVPSIVLNAPPPGGVGTDSSPRTGFGGNPFLRPFTSWNYDASLEYYFGRTSFASITLFHRTLNGFIQNSTYRFDDPTLGVVEITGPVNSGKGRINGAEFQAPDLLRLCLAARLGTRLRHAGERHLSQRQDPAATWRGRASISSADHRSAERRLALALQSGRHLRALRLLGAADL